MRLFEVGYSDTRGGDNGWMTKAAAVKGWKDVLNAYHLITRRRVTCMFGDGRYGGRVGLVRCRQRGVSDEVPPSWKWIWQDIRAGTWYINASQS